MCHSEDRKAYWHEDPVFNMLCDFVAGGNLICLTGSGISKGLKLKSGKVAPDWNKLLRNLKNEMIDSIGKEDLDNLNELLVDHAPGENLIEASSILYNADKDGFLAALIDTVDLAEGETSNTHRKLLELQPKGILTYNYDVAHENAIAKAGETADWSIALPDDNSDIINILKNNFSKQFLLKMHGSVTDKDSMVLTRESYRDLFIKYPFYKAFMQQIFTNYHLLIVGFGMSDPDFAMLLQNVFSTFGSPIQEHIVIKHIKEKSSLDIMYRLRYGLHFLYVNDFGDIPEILNDCISTAGPMLKKLLDDCIDPDFCVRGKAHSDARHLSDAGKKCLADILKTKIKQNIEDEKNDDYSENTANSEFVYTLGVLAKETRNKEYKDFLMNEVVDKSIFSEPIAHAFVYLRDILTNEDLPRVEQWLQRFEKPNFKSDPENEDQNNRVFIYCEAIYYLLKAKF